jgi:ATP-binding cassette subfamily F protein uup
LGGGERKRLHLLTVLMGNPNFLILDEPTNDLDVLTLNVLESYLQKFSGCLIIISHDRYFMDKLVDHMFIFRGDGKVDDFNGTYSEWKDLSKTKKISTGEKKKDQDQLPGPAEEPRKLSYLEKKEMKNIELRLEKLNKRKLEIQKLFESGLDDSKEITNLSIELGSIQSEMDEIEMRWLQLSEFL